MPNAEKTTYVNGLGLPTVLFLIFLVLKLTGAITWSWLWVFAPLWMTAIFLITLVAFLLIVHTCVKE